MTEVDTELLTRARGRTPADPAVRDCWDAVVLAIRFDWLTADEVRQIVDRLRGGQDVTVRQLEFAHAGDQLRVSFQGRTEACSPAAMWATLSRLVAEPVDAATLTGAPIGWTDAGEADLPYRARVAGYNLLIRRNDRPGTPPYTLVGDTVDLADLDDWPPAWRKPVSAGRVPPGPLGAARLRAWAERLCRTAADDPAAVLAALGIAGAIRTTAFESPTVEPPPPGAAGLRLSSRGGRVEALVIELSDATASRFDLDTYLGHGSRLPNTAWHGGHELAYHVGVAGAPAACTVTAGFRTEPDDAAVATTVTLRRDPL
jgi:hypothetical protein